MKRMKIILYQISVFFCWIALLLLFDLPVARALTPLPLNKGTLAPSFPELKVEPSRPLMIVYFFKLSSKPSLKGLEHLNQLYKQYRNAGIGIIAVTQDPSQKIARYLKKHPLPFKVVRDRGKIFEDYGIQVVFPTTFLLGPGKRISDILVGGGLSSHHLMTAIAQRSLQMKKSELALELFTKVLDEDPGNAVAQSGLGSVYLKEGALDRAEAAFSKAADKKADGSTLDPDVILAKEGLVAVHVQKGEPEKALKIAEEVRTADPKSGLADWIEGAVRVRQGDHEGALQSFHQVIDGNLKTDWMKADVYNQAARIYSEQGDLGDAELMYDEAIAHNPFSSEILTNRGVLYEKQGKPQKALAFYREALLLDPKDEVPFLLAKRMNQHLDFIEDEARRKQINALVAELSGRFQDGKFSRPHLSDSWSSRPMTIAFLGIQSIAGGLIREGMATVLQQEIAQNMMSSGRFLMVEREVMDKLLEELKLGSSELTNQETALRLGKLFAARLMITGSLVQAPGGVRLSLRIIDPETSEIKITYVDEIGPDKNLIDLAVQAGEHIRQKIHTRYRLRGKIAMVGEGGEVVINIGRKHGVLPGMRLKVISNGEPLQVDGQIIGHKKKQIGLIEIIEVEQSVSAAKLIEQSEKIQKNQKVMEDVSSVKSDF
ncbi:MAG: tetratricopeptide repeat protein [Nitrospiria bacterium]